MKSLYLESGNKPIRVRLEGPALSIRRKDESPRLIPLRTIGRIYIRGYVDWQLSALLACTDRKITVHFADRKGVQRARLLPGKPPELADSICELLTELEGRSDGMELLDQWEMATGQQQAMRQLQALGYRRRGGHFSSRNLENGVQVQMKRAGVGRHYQWALHNATTILHGRIIEQLTELGLAREPWLTGLQIDRRIQSIARWHLLPLSVRWARKRPTATIPDSAEPFPEVMADLITHLEANSSSTTTEIRHAITRLHHWLLEIL